MPCSEGIACRADAGFSVLEILVVVTVLGLVSLAVRPSLALGTGGPSLQQSGRLLLASLREARALARTGAPASVRIDVEGKRLVAADATVRRLAPDAAITVTVVRQAARAGQGAVVFYPDGSSTGGRILLQGASGSLEVVVDWATGASVSRWAR